ncbi:c-type cytochrome [Pseudoalteromonas pernae]|uniref:c-type cytochrome n=1 Tax=Pseudoalteromonas pernae TaxID=3118054 RepID=UPI003F7E73BB
MTKVLMGAGAIAMSAMAMNAQAADGKALYTEKNCHTCHGADGKAPIMPLYPKLAGQNKDYMVAQMKDIKSGARSNGMSMAMKAMVANVSDEEFEAIAAYLAGVQ